MTAAKRATVYLDPELHRALRVKSAETDRTISDLVNEAVRSNLADDADDLDAFREREKEPTVSFEDLVRGLKLSGKLRD